MTNVEREVLLRMADGCDGALPILHAICLVPLITKGEFFDTCLRAGITGKHLVDLYNNCSKSPLKTIQHVFDLRLGDMSRAINLKDLN